MDILYCSRCNRSIPPGGLDEGKYFQLEGELICPKCYYKAKPHEHSGDTVPVEPIKSDKLLGASRVTPAVPDRPGKPSTTRIGAAARPNSRVGQAVRPTTRIGQAARTPSGTNPAPRMSSSHLRAVGGPPSTSRLKPVKKRARISSTRLRAVRQSDSGLRTFLVIALVLIIGVILAMVFFSSRKVT